MERYGKTINGVIEFKVFETLKEALEKGFKPVEEVDLNKLKVTKGKDYIIRLGYKDIGDSIVNTYTEILNVNLCRQTVEKLKKELSNSDYKITKSYEYNILNLPLPYDIEKLHLERKKLRDEINRLEDLIQNN